MAGHTRLAYDAPGYWVSRFVRAEQVGRRGEVKVAGSENWTLVGGRAAVRQTKEGVFLQTKDKVFREGHRGRWRAERFVIFVGGLRAIQAATRDPNGPPNATDTNICLPPIKG